jgi:hypothetical protein
MEQMNEFFEELDKPLARIPGKWTYVFYLAWRDLLARGHLHADAAAHGNAPARKALRYLVSEATNPKSKARSASRLRGDQSPGLRRRARFADLPGDCTLFLKKTGVGKVVATGKTPPPLS